MLHLSGKSNPWSSEYQEYPTIFPSWLHFWNTYIFWNESLLNMIKWMQLGNYLYINWTNTVKEECFTVPFLKYKNVSIIIIPFSLFINFTTFINLTLWMNWLWADSSKTESKRRQVKRDEVSIKTILFVILFRLNVLKDKHLNDLKNAGQRNGKMWLSQNTRIAGQYGFKNVSYSAFFI